MLLDTIRALNTAGRNALQAACGLQVTAESVSQLGQGSLSFPALGDLVVTGAGVSRVHLGCDALLCRRLAEMDVPTAGGTGLDLLAKAVLEQILHEVPGRHPKGRIDTISIEPAAIRTRGVRTFGFRFVTDEGQFFMLAEVPSRAEWEQARESTFLQIMADSYLPDGWATKGVVAGLAGVENFLVFMRKVETDIFVKLPGAGGAGTVVPAFMIDTRFEDEQRVMRLAMRLPEDPAGAPLPGTPVEARVGVGDRSVEFGMRYVGRGDLSVGPGAVLKCAHFTVPESMAVAQHRASFRIPIEDPIPVELVVGEPGAIVTWRRRRRGRLVMGTLADLSFSGARIRLDSTEAAGVAGQDLRVVCRMHLPGLVDRLDIDGIVRRVATVGGSGQDSCEEVGVEFMPADRQPPGAAERIREFVLSEQRAWLARRIQVAGVGEW